MSEELDGWVDRLLRRLRAARDERTGEILGGECSPERYHELCGRVSELGWVMAQIPEFLRGEDRRKPEREPLRSVEE